MEEGQIKVGGMNSEEDVDNVKHALKEVWGVRSAEVSLTNGEVKFSYNENSASYEDFLQAIKDKGYTIEDENKQS